jgi:hypothetical protein
MVLEVGKSKIMALASGKGLLAASQHGGGHHMVIKSKHATSALSSFSYKNTNAIMEASSS